jgi:NADH-quinone oxidoreductase subunit A
VGEKFVGEFGAEYAALGLFALLGSIFMITLLFAHHLRGSPSRTTEHSEPFDCGERSPGSSDPQLGERVYLIAISFLVFDASLVLLYPWVIVFSDLGAYAFGVILPPLSMLAVGLAYQWFKGGLDWE